MQKISIYNIKYKISIHLTADYLILYNIKNRFLAVLKENCTLSETYRAAYIVLLCEYAKRCVIYKRETDLRGGVAMLTFKHILQDVTISQVVFLQQTLHDDSFPYSVGLRHKKTERYAYGKFFNA